MELKEYLKIFRDDYKMFFVIVALVIIFGFAIQLLAKDKYKIELDLNITRTGYQKDTSDYRYDEFYRLQADERFADTVVRWLGSNVVKNEIGKEIGDTKLYKLKAERLSSQMIRVSFLVAEKNRAEKVTGVIDNILNTKTAELNLEQKNPQWFKILVSHPVIGRGNVEPFILLGMLLLGGIFIAFWVILIKHYLK